MTMLPALVRRDLQLLWQGRARLLPLFAYPLLILLICVFALDVKTLDLPVRQALVLIAFILAQLTLTGYIWPETQNGVMAQLYLARRSLIAFVLVRFAAYLMALLLPLALLVLFAGQLLLQVPLPSLLLPVILAMPTLLGLSLIVGALTAGPGHHTALPALLLLPLYVPVIILMALGATATDLAIASASHYWLAALAMLSVGLLPMGIAAALRQSLDLG